MWCFESGNLYENKLNKSLSICLVFCGRYLFTNEVCFKLSILHPTVPETVYATPITRCALLHRNETAWMRRTILKSFDYCMQYNFLVFYSPLLANCLLIAAFQVCETDSQNRSTNTYTWCSLSLASFFTFASHLAGCVHLPLSAQFRQNRLYYGMQIEFFDHAFNCN